MRNARILCFICSLICSIPVHQLYSQSSDNVYFKVNDNIRVIFTGKPTRYFYQTPLGDITIYEYKPEINANDSNCLYSIALYKTLQEEVRDVNLINQQTDAKLNEVISSDEMSANNLGGKILSKDEINYKGAHGIRMKILFSDLSELNEIEGQKNVVYNAAYFKQKGLVLKLWTYTPVNKENKKVEMFFNSLLFN